MKKWLTLAESVLVMSMLFGMFFGAGNLIFPVYMGQMAGQNVWPALIGFLITGVSLPLLAVAALGKSRSDGLYDLSIKVSKPFGIGFTCLLYLAIGPLFAIPRCATTSFTVGITPLLEEGNSLYLAIFSLLFFLAAAYFALKSDRILTWIGKFLNPIFLLFLAVLLIRVFTSPMADYTTIEATGSYISGSFFSGFYEGYNTLDACAGLAFGIVVVTVIRSLDINDGDAVAANTIVAGITSCILMGVIYVALALAGAQSSTTIGLCSNGGEALSKIAQYYFGDAGALLLAAIVTLACLKTTVGLITSCSETFSALFPNFLSIKKWSLLFTVTSFLVANLGLNQIISLSLPFLMFLYPLSIVLIALALSSNLFHKTPSVYKATMYVTLPFAFLELLRSFSYGWKISEWANMLANAMPLGSHNLEWLIPAVLAFVISLVLSKYRKTDK